MFKNININTHYFKMNYEKTVLFYCIILFLIFKLLIYVRYINPITPAWGFWISGTVILIIHFKIVLIYIDAYWYKKQYKKRMKICN